MTIKKTLTGIVLAGALALFGCDVKPAETKPFNRYIDLNGDGQKEIIAVVDVEQNVYIASEYRKHELQISLSGPNGYTEQKISYPGKPLEVSFEDLNRDERLDILTVLDVEQNIYIAPEYRKYELRVAYQQEDGSFANPKTIKTYEGRF